MLLFHPQTQWLSVVLTFNNIHIIKIIKIIVLNELQAVEVLRQMNGVTHPWTLKFIHYSQSNACEYKEDSSVSYAAGVLFSKP